MVDFILILIKILFFYFIGSIPTSLIIGKKFLNKDLRLLGSKNMGASNAVRVLGKKYGLIVFVLDFLKGFLLFFFQNEKYFIYFGLFTVLGHMFSIFSKFKGGKAIATSVGIITIIDPFIGFLGIMFFLIFVRISGYSSLSSLLSTSLVNFFLWFKWFFLKNKINNIINLENLFIILFITILIFIKHYNNIINLIHGRENKFKFKSKNK
ncbi:MAG: glycerol-3-phosphate 1-O-acyltransferase PlsY [Candidatus Phytoplasma stylosanthis]|uniref:glycerol-3-phosphate 1-O-acyltransferase PlsY n=1 Tax=Candidatus Phytoplasma stylosanthis TaxID=2798314 RepID=UPI0029395715|nr:glycerol-3-phosphate 1-O-acyltransferase PlsY [Candidatus Phytoplasma stylosanthis]MDV3168040.1 glycerol-3-phosphate 1-O-acyltransferase PlsY [Candidatus Phytoplasma stylosanthis]MDV3170804.1 glycerol-3-phosphate 1-O-acyltransferase PlsY [Candidatus Phytoplasma stylosanthis]MDV3173600.1 glycerol-3-phosphate 1-O-acyltransferase PlsY [Candidatus Phytoplasma stylosanthis]MDV3174182.1 glycerol-3-phosphate 1-O-acyltransferase PlsY [Candidatus Phytoplasma stylosanthis]MDV3202527.1 glycerol-3-phos